jgi:DNA polymerase-1
VIEDKKEHYAKYGWTCDETNLATLPDSAPEAAHLLTEWLCLEGRRSSLAEYAEAYNKEDGRIHPKFWNIGAWTHRMSHSKPNLANIVAPWDSRKDPNTGVDRIKAEYDTAIRGLFIATPSTVLVGTDADAIQLRLLAHYMESDRYVEAINSGSKDLGTDIHSVNMRALGLDHLSRDDAKTFIYAWLLGAGINKIAGLLRTGANGAQSAVSRFLASFPELSRLRNVKIARDAARGFFIGLDGRRIQCSSEHLMLAGYLQAGEAVVMKHANVLWRKWLDEKGIWYRQVNFVHDEWQTEAKPEDADEVGERQCEAIRQVGLDLGVRCPLKGNYNIGANWAESH